mgnify:CR=1 FL=1
MNHTKFTPCFLLVSSLNWKSSNPDDWELSVVDFDGSEKHLGHKQIDGAICKIYQFNDKIFAVAK